MSHLSSGVDAGIGSSRADDLRALSYDYGEGLLDGGLNRRDVRLRLPSVQVGAVVLDK